MKIRIYQIDTAKDEKGVCFEGLSRLRVFQGSGLPKRKIYEKVFDGEVDCDDLEAVYRMFNINKPEGYQGRSLSVSDVVEVDEDDEKKLYYCDSIGFKQIEFDEEVLEDDGQDR